MSDAAPSTPLACPRCAAVLGQVVERDGAPRLLLPHGATVRALTGECACGAPWNWTASARRLEQLLKDLERSNSYR